MSFVKPALKWQIFHMSWQKAASKARAVAAAPHPRMSLLASLAPFYIPARPADPCGVLQTAGTLGLEWPARAVGALRCGGFDAHWSHMRAFARALVQVPGGSQSRTSRQPPAAGCLARMCPCAWACVRLPHVHIVVVPQRGKWTTALAGFSSNGSEVAWFKGTSRF